MTDPNPGNNSATDTDTLTPMADLAITKTDGVTTAMPGGTTTYTIVVSNNGPSNVTGATVADNLPSRHHQRHVSPRCGSGGASGVTASGSGNINDTVNLPVGGTVTYTVIANVASSATGTMVEHGDGDRAGRGDRSEPQQQQRHRHRHTDAAGRPGDHQDRRRDQRQCPAARRRTRSW